jgi:hypothetical protein
VKNIVRASCLALLALLLPLVGALAYYPAPAQPPQDFLFGVINDNGDHYDDEWNRGIRATTFELQWRLYEPQEGVYDTTYISHMQQKLASLQSQGWYVQLVPGFQYVPDWVFANYPNMRFVNQYGEPYIPADGSFRVTNAPFNPQARALIAGYLARIFQDFDASAFHSVRVGGSVQGELRYPPPDWNGHSNSFWAFDSHAQDPAVSGIPAAVAGWRPGIDPNPGSVGRDQLLVNSGFEETHPYYAVPAWAAEDEVTATIVGDSHSGNGALRLGINSPHRIAQYVRVQPGTAYTFGGWVRSADGSGQARLFINQYDGDNNPAGAPFAKAESNSSSWTYVSGTLTTAGNTTFLKVELDGDRAGAFYFDDLSLQPAGAGNDLSRDIDVPLAFYDWYVNTLTAYQNWQIDTLRQYYSGRLDVLYAGKGVMANHVTAALTNDLRGDGWSEDSSALYSGTAFDRHVAGLDTTANIALYLTGIETPGAGLVDDTSLHPGDWSAARWIGYLAQTRGLEAWGENGGKNDAAEMYLVAARMHANGFKGMMWAFESELYGGNGYASIDDYETIITIYTNPDLTFLPALHDS